MPRSEFTQAGVPESETVPERAAEDRRSSPTRHMRDRRPTLPIVKAGGASPAQATRRSPDHSDGSGTVRTRLNTVSNMGTFLAKLFILRSQPHLKSEILIHVTHAPSYLVRISFKGKFSVSRWPSLKRMTRLTSNSTLAHTGM